MNRKMVNLDYYEIERFLEYLNDKVQDVYLNETTREIKNRLNRLQNNQSFEEQYED